MSNKKNNLRLVDAPIYRYWQALYLSFFSRRLYIDVAKRWRGYGVLYLLLVIAIASIPLSARIIFDFNQYFNEQLVLPLERFPSLLVQNGEVSFDSPMPYLIKNKTGGIVAIIDTTGKVEKMSSAYPELTILVTKDKLYFRPPKFHIFFIAPVPTAGDEVYIQPFNKKSNEVFVGKEWVQSSGLLKIKFMTECLVYPLLTMFVFGLYLAFMITIAFIGQLFAIIVFKFRLTFKNACRLFLVASTAQVFLFFITLTTNTVFPGIGFFYMIILALYFNYVILIVRRESNKMVRS